MADFFYRSHDRLPEKTRTFETRPKNQWQPDLLDTLGIFQGREKFDVKLRFTPTRSIVVKNEMWHENQRAYVDDQGFYNLTIPASNETEVMMEILKHGSQVEVLEPAWLRKKVAIEIRESLKNYEEHRK